MELSWRSAMRPGYLTRINGRLQRPVGVYRNTFGVDGKGWHWACRLDCWAALTSGWYLRSQEAAVGEGVQHLRDYHYPLQCRGGCEGHRHSWWPNSWAQDDILGEGYFCHLDFWYPILPLLSEQVTLRA